MLTATSNIVYIRAALRSFSAEIKVAGGIIEALSEHVEFTEIFAPYFSGARPFWQRRTGDEVFRNRSGALGELILKYPESVRSAHPTHSFAGNGYRVAKVLAEHNGAAPCFSPIRHLADECDFSMLLLGCTKSSPGFSTVHATQFSLGLTQKHLIRYLYRWDISETNGKFRSVVAPEAPGCSRSFGKFYPHYKNDDNLIQGSWGDAKWIFIKSARVALATETKLLASNPRFVDCGRSTCPTCRLRLY